MATIDLRSPVGPASPKTIALGSQPASVADPQEEGVLDYLGNAANDFFGKVDPRHPDISGKEGFGAGYGRQLLKAASLLVPASAPMKGASLLMKMGQGAAAAIPASFMMAASNAPKGADLGGFVRSGEEGIAPGAVVGAALPAAGAAASWLQPKLAAASNKFGNMASRGYGNILAKKIIPEAATNAAYDTGLIKFGDTVTNIADKAKAQASVQSGIKRGITMGMDKARMAVDAPATIARMEAGIQEAKKAGNWKLAKILDEYITKLTEMKDLHDSVTGQIPITAYESLKTNIGKEAQSAFDKVPGTASTKGEALMDLYSMVKRETEEAVRSQADKAPALAEAFIPAKQALGHTLAIRDASKVGKAREFARKIPILPMMGGAYGAWNSPHGGGLQGFLEGALGGAAIQLGATRAPSSLGVIARKLSQSQVPEATLTPEIAALIQYLRSKKEPENAP